MRRIIPVLLSFFLFNLPLYAQDTERTHTDSLLQQYRQQQIATTLARQADSIEKAGLLSSISALKVSDSLKKETLEKQLLALEERETFRMQEKKKKIDALRSTVTAYPVTGFFHDTLFFIYTGTGSFSATDRAKAISDRIRQLGDDFSFQSDSLQTVRDEQVINIVYRDQVIISISENDALWNDLPLDSLAARQLAAIRNSLKVYETETGFTVLAKEIGMALLVILVIVLVIVYTGKLFRWMRIKIRKQQGKVFRGLKIRTYTLLDAGNQVALLLRIMNVLKWAIILLVIYITLPILFGIFPWTQHFAGQLFGYILNPLKKIIGAVWNYLPNLFTILVIVVIFRYVLKAINFLKKEILEGKLVITGFYPDWANPTYQIVRILVFAFMLVVIFPYLPGSNSPVFKGVSVFLGFLFTFGSAGSLSNIVAGLVLTYMRLFRIGDRVKIGDVTGDVVEKSLLVTRLRTIKNEIISIPNSSVMSNHVTNYSAEAQQNGLIVHTTVTIGYDVEWQSVHDALTEAARRTDMIMEFPAPFVLQTGLEDFYVAYQLNAYTQEPNKQAIIYSQLHQHIQDVFNERGIEILSPHYRAGRDGSEPAIPPQYRKP